MIFIIKGFQTIVFIFIVFIFTEESWRMYRPKHCGNNNKDEDNTPKTLNDSVS